MWSSNLANFLKIILFDYKIFLNSDELKKKSNLENDLVYLIDQIIIKSDLLRSDHEMIFDRGVIWSISNRSDLFLEKKLTFQYIFLLELCSIVSLSFQHFCYLQLARQKWHPSEHLEKRHLYLKSSRLKFFRFRNYKKQYKSEKNP